MRKSVLLLGVAIALCQFGLALAQTQSRTPAAPPPGPATPTVNLPTAVEEAPLAQDAFSTGMLARGEGALEPTLWRRADPARVSALLDLAPSRPDMPAIGEALRRALLSPGSGPQGAPASLGGKKLLALTRAGFWEDARTIASLSNAPRNDPWVGQALATADLLEGSTNEACKRNAALSSGRDAPYWVRLRVLCFLLAGQSDAADLTLNLLREQGFLSEADEIFLGWAFSGAPPKTAPEPQTALHLAAMRKVGAAPTAGALGRADGGVLKSIARDATLPATVRIEAAERAAAMGVLPAAELTALFDSIEVDVALVGKAPEIIRARADDPMTDAIIYHSVKSMSAPEFLRDKAARIADALALGDSFPRAYAAALLYAEDLAALEGAVVSQREASRFALARMAIGDGNGAARWLFAMIGSGGAAPPPDADRGDLVDLTNLLAVLDPISAKAVAEAANVALDPRTVRPAGQPFAPANEDIAARIIESAFDAAIDGAPGQAALAALAASTTFAADDPAGRVIVSQSLRAAGLNELRRRMDFEAVWRSRFAAPTAAQSAPAAAPTAAPPAVTPASAPAGAPAAIPAAGGRSPAAAPRMKPKTGEPG